MPLSPPDPSASIPPAELSRVIGEIYDCAIDPAGWPVALRSMCRLVGATLGSIALYDPIGRRTRFRIWWGESPDWPEHVRRFDEIYAPLMPFYDAMLKAEIDEPVDTGWMIRTSGVVDFYTSEFYRGWGEPAGLKDVVSTVILKSESQYCAFALHTPIERDLVGPSDRAVAALLGPHVRRAVVISDLLEMRAIEAHASEQALDMLSTPIVLTNAEAQIVRANRAARDMLRAGDPILSDRGRLATHHEVVTASLRASIRQAAENEAAIGTAGLGLPAPFADQRPALAHVLPLASPPVRTRIEPSATAAIFISTAEKALAPSSALAALFELTPAEHRVLDSVLAGRNQTETAAHLGLAESTVKSHLGRIFSKTGVTGQSELGRLAERLAARLALQL